MPSLDTLTVSQVVKLLLIGDSGTGKTGSLASLVKAGYNVRLLDFDNGWESLAAAVRRTCPSRLPSVDVESLRDRYKSGPLGPVIDGAPKAFTKGLGLLDKWSDGTRPCDWGPQSILVIDSLTFLSDAAYAWADALNPSAKDKRQIYDAAQKAIKHVLELLTGPTFNTNVIVTAHVLYIDLPDGTKKGFPTAVGQALSPNIPRYFNSTVRCVTQLGGKRVINTVSDGLIDLKNPRNFEMKSSLPIEDGLGTFFEILRGEPTWDKNTSQNSSLSTKISQPRPSKEECSPPQNSPKQPTTLRSISLHK